jgi:hypothetical protein
MDSQDGFPYSTSKILFGGGSAMRIYKETVLLFNATDPLFQALIQDSRYRAFTREYQIMAGVTATKPPNGWEKSVSATITLQWKNEQ